jgi:hypothetical protein
VRRCEVELLQENDSKENCSYCLFFRPAGSADIADAALDAGAITITG